MLREGEIFKTNSCGNLVVTKYVDCSHVHVRFIKTQYETVATSSNIKLGMVKDKFLPSVHGVGIIGDEVARIGKVMTKEYCLWQSMLKRCYCIKTKGNSPTYADCFVSENFKYYPFFKEWCNKQIGFSQDGFQLDKDLLIKDNKIYSEHTCCFLPQEINTTIQHRSYDKTLKIGVSQTESGRYRFRFYKTGSKSYSTTGTFKTEIEAFQAYKEAKEAYVKELANKWKDRIDPKAYNALLCWEVEDN